MAVTLSLMSSKQGELKRFFDNLFGYERHMDDNVIEWICVYRDRTKAIKCIDTVSCNLRDYNLSLWVKIGEEDIIEVTSRNIKKIREEIEYIAS